MKCPCEWSFGGKQKSHSEEYIRSSECRKQGIIVQLLARTAFSKHQKYSAIIMLTVSKQRSDLLFLASATCVQLICSIY
jgi:hypothetical protein